MGAPLRWLRSFCAYRNEARFNSFQGSVYYSLPYLTNNAHKLIPVILTEPASSENITINQMVNSSLLSVPPSRYDVRLSPQSYALTL